MTQPLASNYIEESVEERRIRIMLAYKSLIFSILQKKLPFLFILAAIVAALILFVFHRQGQKNFFRLKTFTSIVYNPRSDIKQQYMPINTVFTIISTNDVKRKALENAKIPKSKMDKAREGLQVSYDRATANQLTLSVSWDDEEETVAIARCFERAAIKEYANYRQDTLKAKNDELASRKEEILKDIDTINEKLRELVRNYPSPSLQQELERLKQNAYDQQDELSELNKLKANEQLRQDHIKSDIENLGKERSGGNSAEGSKKIPESKYHVIINNYNDIKKLIRDRDEAEVELEIKKAQYTKEMTEVKVAAQKFIMTQKILAEKLKNLGISENDFITLDPSYIALENDLKKSRGVIDTIDLRIDVVKKSLASIQLQITEVREQLPEEEKLKLERTEKIRSSSKMDEEINSNTVLISFSNNELESLNKTNIPKPFPINGLTPKQYIIALFAGGCIAGMVAIVIVFIAAQFGCIDSSEELSALGEIEVFKVSESHFQKLTPKEREAYVTNVLYSLSQSFEDIQCMFFGSLQGSYPTDLLFEQLHIHFTMEGERVFVLRLEPNTAEQDFSADNDDDPIANSLMWISKKNDDGVFKLENADLLTSNGLKILKSDLDKLQDNYEKILILHKRSFTGKELLLKQAITLTQCCFLSIGKKRSPRSLLKFLRYNKNADENNNIFGIFTEP